MGPLDTAAVRDAFAAANSGAEWATLAVVIGLIIEFAVLLIFTKEVSRAEKWLLVFANILVAGGVGGEYVFSGRATNAAVELQRVSDEKVEGLTAQAEGAKAEIVEAQKAAKQAEQQTEREREARVQLEQKIAPRRFGPENLKGAIKKLSDLPLTGQTATVTSYALDLESGLFAGQIIDLLKGAGLSVTDNRSSVMPFGSFIIGVHISGIDAEAVQNVAIVIFAFSNAVIKIDAAPADQTAPPDKSTIEILVGTKPIDAPPGGLVVGADNKVLVPPIGIIEQK